MNKHFIILPVLLTSAVSLHVLSYNLEEPPEIVQNSPIPSGSPLQSGQSEIPVVSASSDVVAVVPSGTSKSPNTIPANSSASPIVKTSTAASPNVIQPSVTTTNTTVTTTVTTPTSPSPSAVQNIQIASALIPTKTYGEMVREAKQIGGRVDPFLSMKPPEMEKLPELPTPSPNANFTIASKNSGNTSFPTTGPFKGIIKDKSIIPNPPKTFIPNGNPPVFESLPPSKNGKSNQNGTSQIANKDNKTKINQDNSIIFPTDTKIEKGLQLTGIITGNKPFALIKVDNESKVYGIGDIVRSDGRIKVVSINFENQYVTLSDNKNRKVKLEIKS